MRATRRRGGRRAGPVGDYRAGPRGVAVGRAGPLRFRRRRRVLLVFGGSQGAASINRAVAGRPPTWPPPVWPCCTPTGPRTPSSFARPSRDPPYVAVPYLDRMELAYAAADLAICRSGAMTVAEVSAVGLPAVYVPLPIGNGEQRLNALPVVNAGGGMLVADADLTPRFVADQVAGLLNDPRGWRR
ncbi:glycosyltransferase family 28 C-terminal domain protein [Mycobacterium xenopi 4042]|uniref:Glycosyltransferase family 28 C-terminal domain protein n=1 Tax=Mycobacterium xenopi 4042 TaxID=1299334 RepID=X7ZWM1_MYCXE|nr:glycosyltransferase family 28 C-terminal domain protein [Mycobacterium xenopi 4042]